MLEIADNFKFKILELRGSKRKKLQTFVSPSPKVNTKRERTAEGVNNLSHEER